MGHQINSLHFRLSKSYNIILCRSSSQGESEYTIITFLFLPAQEGTITALRHQHHHTLTGLSQGKHYYFTSQLTDCTTRKKLQPGSSSWKSRRDAAGSPTIVKRFSKFILNPNNYSCFCFFSIASNVNMYPTVSVSKNQFISDVSFYLNG